MQMGVEVDERGRRRRRSRLDRSHFPSFCHSSTKCRRRCILPSLSSDSAAWEGVGVWVCPA